MSIQYCERCDAHVDTDWNAEHFLSDGETCANVLEDLDNVPDLIALKESDDIDWEEFFQYLLDWDMTHGELLEELQSHYRDLAAIRKRERDEAIAKREGLIYE